MRAVVQRVASARVELEGELVGSCGTGYLVLLGVAEGDGEADAQKLWRKLRDLRIMPDEAGKTNLSLIDVAGELLVVSQFTLMADCRRGRRPSFIDAAEPDLARRLYEYFVELARADVAQVQTGVFGADMRVSLVNDGPFTVVIDSRDLA